MVYANAVISFSYKNESDSYINQSFSPQNLSSSHIIRERVARAQRATTSSANLTNPEKEAAKEARGVIILSRENKLVRLLQKHFKVPAVLIE